MDEKRIRKLIGLLSAEEIGYLQRLLRHGPRDTSEFNHTPSALKSLEVRDLVFRRGATVSLTYRGKLVARHL